MTTFLKKVLFDNIPVKLIALALAFLVWYTIGQEITDKVDMQLRYQVSLPPATAWKIVGPSAWEVTVTARGAYSDVQRLRTIPWPLTGSHTIDPASLPTGEDEIHFQVPVNVANFHLPLTQVSFSDFDPKVLDVRLARMEEKTLRVLPVLEGEAGEGYIVAGTPGVSPQEVRVRGPRGFLKTLKEIETLPVVLTGRTSSFTEKKRVRTLTGDHELECDRVVTVDVTIREKPGKVTVRNVPVFMGYPPGFPHDKYQITPNRNTVDIELEGPKPLLARVDSSKIRVYAEVKGKVNEKDFEGSNTINDNAKISARLGGFTPEELPA